jgi:murein DD-endopeptidase MepM/ murein hydrolase activator NlpD
VVQLAAFWSGFGRGACGVVAAAVLGVGLAGCSSSTSRFDFPVFNLTKSDSPNADYAATSSLPPVVPEESVYASGDASSGQWQRASLLAAYSPPASGRVRDHHANYPAPAAPQAEPAVWRGAQTEGRHIKVEKGDTLSILSRRYGVSVEAIMAANNLPDGRLNVGQELVIPTAPGMKAAVKSAKPAAVAAAAAKEPSPVPAKAAAKEMGQAGSAATPEVRVVKTTTILPPGASSLAEEESDASAKTQDQGDVAVSPEITGEGGKRVASVDQLPAPDPLSGNSFRWPVKGRVISPFGARPDGGHNDGIDVAVPQGTSVQAAENGVVAYAGNELKGYGNLVLIRHANNWVSAYAHNEEILVKRGDKVKRGQVIAKAGATGSVSQPLVHFELRKGSRPVDPTKYMSDHAASAD